MRLAIDSLVASINGVRVVDGASLSVSAGQLVGLIGPNGGGKSTLLRAGLGISPIDAGSVTLEDHDLLAKPPRERARHIAFLPQERRIEWRIRVRDLVMLGRYPHHAGFGGPSAEDIAAVDRALATVGVAHLAERPATDLSGGERTLVLLARALAVEAPLLVVDEPIAALDPYHQLQVMEILKQLTSRGVGVLAILHDLAYAARFMDSLVLMNAGKVIASGAPADVLADTRLAEVYRIGAIHGAHEGAAWTLPWRRLD